MNINWRYNLYKRDSGDLYGFGYVDRCLCQAFEWEWSEYWYAHEWVEIVGMQIANGRTLEQLVGKYERLSEALDSPDYVANYFLHLWRITAYLNEHFLVRRH